MPGKPRAALDDPLSLHFPSLPDWAGRVLLLHVLNQTAGLPDDLDVFAADRAERLDPGSVLRFLARQKQLKFEPGSNFDHSNSGDVLLTELVARNTGMPFAEFVERRILRPLGMEQTLVLDGAASEIPDRAVGYRSTSSGFEIDPQERERATGTGLVFTTVDDLGLWYRGLTEYSLLGARTTEMMFHMPLTASGGSSHLAMGWTDETVSDASAGFGTHMTVYPDEHRKPVIIKQ